MNLEVLEQKTVRAYSIIDIKNWQKELQENLNLNSQTQDEELISLPTLQRGFVWKPYQIESLWDSILRGYPIGALLLSDSDGRKDLLDGQQRCTSIALGFQNPFEDGKSVLNLRKNIPSVWIDLKPLEPNKYGLKMGLHVLTRSHPWGYQLNDHRKPLPTHQREKALEYLRRRCGDQDRGFSKLKMRDRTPWDSHFPVPLYMLLNADTSTPETWKTQLWAKISENLMNIETRNGKVDYTQIEEGWLSIAYEAVRAAKSLVIPEIPVNSQLMTRDDDQSQNEENATLFVRLNAEGTRITGEELIYSLLKAIFPDAKKLVEDIDLRFLAPSKLVNIFIRLVLIQQSNGDIYYRNVSLTDFRKHLKDESFENRLIKLINDKEAKKLTERANEILSEGLSILPKVFIKEMISGTPDLFLVLLTYINFNQKTSEEEKRAIQRTFLQVFLFGKKREKVAAWLFKLLAENKFISWKKCSKEVLEKESEFILHLIEPCIFEKMLLDNILPVYLKGKIDLRDIEATRSIIMNDNEVINKFTPYSRIQNDNEAENQQYRIEKALNFWIDLLNKVLWNKYLLMICQRQYFKKEFEEFMEFDAIEDTNRPWDWDHIYPNSWVKGKRISQRVRRLVNTNGNYRALSFNTNRSESNRQSPYTRFHGENPDKKVTYREDSFIKENDLKNWKQLTDSDTRLKDEKDEKVGAFVQAVLTRTSNIYKECYEIINHTKE